MVDRKGKPIEQVVSYRHDLLLFKPVVVEVYRLGNVTNLITRVIFVEEVRYGNYELLVLLV